MMRLFVSYSRHDTAVVRPIVMALEADGHDVWIDTDDLRGSERWRTAIAEAIRSSDVVLLMVSPAAMSSENVEREMAVAAEAATRIIPVLIEPATLSVGLLYDLSGVQNITFIDRPFDGGMADLSAALVVQSADEPLADSTRLPRDTPPAVSPLPPRNRTVPRGVLYGIAAVGAIVAMVLLTGQFDADDDNAGTTVPAGTRSAPSSDDSVIATVADSSASENRALTEATFDTTVWFAGFSIRATGAVYDETDGDLTVDVLITNEQPASADSSRLFFEEVLVIDGSRFWISCNRCSRLTPGTSTRAVLDAFVGGAVDLQDASIEFGGTDQHRAIVPLDGRPGTTERPTTQPLEGTLVDAGRVTFTVERLEIVPAGCSGPSSNLSYIPGQADEMSLVIVGTAVSSERFDTLFGDALLTAPDGTTFASSSLSGYMYALSAGEPQPDVYACFTVPLPLAGDYLFTVAHADATTFPDPIAITF